MPVKEILEPRDLRVRECPDDIHEGLEDYVKFYKRHGKPRMNKQSATIEILRNAFSKIKLK